MSDAIRHNLKASTATIAPAATITEGPAFTVPEMMRLRLMIFVKAAVCGESCYLQVMETQKDAGESKPGVISEMMPVRDGGWFAFPYDGVPDRVRSAKSAKAGAEPRRIKVYVAADPAATGNVTLTFQVFQCDLPPDVAAEAVKAKGG